MSDIPDQVTAKRCLGFDDLPNELKLHILSFTLRCEDLISASNHGDVEQMETTNLVGLIHTNHAMRALAREVYYRSNTFIIHRAFGGNPSRLGYGAGKFKFRYPPFGLGHLVRSLQLEIEDWNIFPHNTSGLLAVPSRLQRRRGAPAYNDWLALLRPLAAGASHNTAWQSHFPQLDVLILKIDFASCFDANMGMDVRSLPQHSTIDIRPRKVEIDVGDRVCTRCFDRCEIALVDVLRES